MDVVEAGTVESPPFNLSSLLYVESGGGVKDVETVEDDEDEGIDRLGEAGSDFKVVSSSSSRPVEANALMRSRLVAALLVVP